MIQDFCIVDEFQVHEIVDQCTTVVAAFYLVRFEILPGFVLQLAGNISENRTTLGISNPCFEVETALLVIHPTFRSGFHPGSLNLFLRIHNYLIYWQTDESSELKQGRSVMDNLQIMEDQDFHRVYFGIYSYNPLANNPIGIVNAPIILIAKDIKYTRWNSKRLFPRKISRQNYSRTASNDST